MLPGCQKEAAGLRLYALDVGEGQAILLQRGEHGVLIDSGHAGKVRHVLDRLHALGVRQLDMLILSHLHPDHASGYFRLREAFPSMQVLDHHRSPDEVKSLDIMRWLAEALAQDSKRRQLRGGDVFEWQGVTIRALWPQGAPGPNINRYSLVLEIVYGTQRALLMGDVDSRVEAELMRAGKIKGTYDILVAGHHGSKGTSSDAFLQKVRPAYSLISINADNIRGYPAPNTVNRLRQYSRQQLLTTYADGEICLQLTAAANTLERCISKVPVKND